MNYKLYSLSESCLEFAVSIGSLTPCLSNLGFFFGDILFFIGKMVGAIVSSSDEQALTCCDGEFWFYLGLI